MHRPDRDHRQALADRARAELGIDALVERAAVITCDSPLQAGAHLEPFFVDAHRLVDLADVLDARAPGRTSQEQITVHASVDLAGSEVTIARALLDHHRAAHTQR